MTESSKISGVKRVALITGAAQRIGAAIAESLHGQGINIILHFNSSQSQVKDLNDKLNDRCKNTAIPIQADLNDIANIYNFVRQAAETWGRLDILINNASVYYPAKLNNTTSEIWEHMFNVNLKSCFFLIQATKNYLFKTKGCIINMSDINANNPKKYYSAYCASKAGLSSITKSLALELAPQIRVNEIAPGTILWPEYTNTLNDAEKDEDIEKIPLKKIGGTNSIVDAVKYLINTDYVTGHSLVVDGGRLLVK